MLWNGVSSTPRLRAHRCISRSSSSSAAAAAAAPSRGGGQNQYSARQPRRWTFHGSPCRSMTACTPSVNRSASGIATAKSSSRSAEESAARAAESAIALAVSVPPTPETSASAVSMSGVRRSATSSVMPYAASGTPPAIGLPTTRRSGSRPQARVAPPGARAQGVRLVDDQQHVVLAGDLADRFGVALVREHDADVGERRLHEQAGHVALGQPPVERVEVVEGHHGRGQATSTCGPIAPGRGITLPSSSTASVSSTVPW